MGQRRMKVWLVQQGVWNLPLESMPLAIGYLKATVDADADLRRECDVRIFNFRGGDSIGLMAARLFWEVPDVLAFSVLGWSYRKFGSLSETFRQLNPNGLVVFGGTHVAYQAPRVFSMFPTVDVVVNGEGEFVFPEILRAELTGPRHDPLGDIDGISFHTEAGTIEQSPDRERIRNLDDIPSPFLSGAIPMNDSAGNFRYDVALMETNRGCPYACSFCYWGGAIGQKVRCFSRERLREELEFFARHRVSNVVLCDANFGMLRRDEEFIEDFIMVRERFGFPKTIETSWAKNKSPSFYSIVHRMKEAGLRSSFTLALQTLNDGALQSMQRKNMKLNEWEELARWLGEQGLECYAELIWGAPGETPASFLEGYDRLSRHVSRIAVYPLMLLPNTKYAKDRDTYRFVTVRGEGDDFEHVLAHQDMTMRENREMLRFLFWARLVAENGYFRNVWLPARVFLGMEQSSVLRSLDRWTDRVQEPVATKLRDYRQRMIDSVQGRVIPEAVRFLHSDPGVPRLLARWWEEEVVAATPGGLQRFLRESLRFDQLTNPVYVAPEYEHERLADLGLRIEVVEGERYYVRDDQLLEFDIPAIVAALRTGGRWEPSPTPFRTKLYYRAGFIDYIDNQEFTTYFFGRLEREMQGSRKATHLAGNARPSDESWAPSPRSAGRPMSAYAGRAGA